MKKLVMLGIACSVGFALDASATDLLFKNHTDFDSTTKIKGICSSLIGEKGITRKHKDNPVNSRQIQLACRYKFPCVGEVYMNANCEGDKPVATGVFTEAEGITKFTELAPQSFKVHTDGPFIAIIDPVAH